MNPSSGASQPANPLRRASLDDVAQAAGVGKSTAARALKGDKHVARKTQRVVMEAAQKLGYQPDPILSTLARERWRGRDGYSGISVALVHYPGTRDEEAELIASLEGMNEVAALRGYKIDVLDASELPHAARLEEILVTRNYRGLALGPMHCAAEWLQVDWSLFSLVAFGEGTGHPETDRVGHDHLNRTQLAFRHVFGSGYRRPGLALVQASGGKTQEDTLSGFQLSCLQHGAESCPVYIGSPLDAKPFLHWVSENQPDAIVADTPLLHSWLEAAGLAGPRGIGFASLFLTRNEGNLAGLRPEADQVGRRAMELLDHHICTNSRGLPASPARLVITPAWQDGPSLAPRG